MFDYTNSFTKSLAQLKAEGRYRTFAELERVVGSAPRVKWHTPTGEIRDVTVWCGNDYLGMGHNSNVLSAMRSAIDTRGAGAGGTRNISGSSDLIVELESALARVRDKESALLFTSGYVANEAALSVIPAVLPNCIVISDSSNHASMIHGISSSKANKVIFRHNDIKHLEEILRNIPVSQPKLIAFESVYSMDGDFAPIGDIIQLAKRYGALTYLDETHGVGLYGRRGGGVAEELGLASEIDVIQGGLGKGYGVVGGFIAGNSEIVDVVRSFGRGFIFTTALPPAVVAGALASVEYLECSQSERSKHREIVQFTKDALTRAKLPTLDSPSHIIPLMVYDAVKCKEIAEYLLWHEGIYTQPINYPTVPRGTERFRLTPSPLHLKDDVEKLVCALIRAWAKFSLAKAA